MQENQRVADMVTDVLTRQADVRAKRTGEPFDDSLRAVLETEAGRQLKELAMGSPATRVRRSGRRTWRRNGPGNVVETDNRNVVSKPTEPMPGSGLYRRSYGN